MSIEVQIIQEQTDLTISDDSVKKLVEGFLEFAAVDFDEVSIHFVDTNKICALHSHYFDDPSTTDCISFPMDDPDQEGYRVMGDIFVCPSTAISYVSNHGSGDVYKETTLYVIHGLLHLLGYDDIEDKDIVEMRESEAQLLSLIDENDLWLQA